VSVNVNKVSASSRPGISTVGSTMASATSGSRPRASAVAAKVERTAEMVFSSAVSPVAPEIGVAAPITPPGAI
jgi:hypothetical protein